MKPLATEWLDLNRLNYIYLKSVSEPNDNVLELVIEQAPASDFREELAGLGIGPENPVDVEELLAVYRIEFPEYVAYAIRDESFARNDTGEKFQGTLARLYRQSKFLEYVHATSTGLPTNGMLKHYSLLCLEHVIEVVSSGTPNLTELELR
ncbi:MAG: hypothetical protein VB933_09190 [Pseudomonadales bacterium]